LIDVPAAGTELSVGIQELWPGLQNAKLGSMSLIHSHPLVTYFFVIPVMKILLGDFIAQVKTTRDNQLRLTCYN
jgi:hypothetical protein